MLLNITELGQIVASRTLVRSPNQIITIRIGQPFVPVDYGGNFCCPYQIAGIGDERIRYGSGIDSLQALYIALINISTDLYTTEEGRSGKVTWEGSVDLGLPVAEAIRDILPKDKS